MNAPIHPAKLTASDTSSPRSKGLLAKVFSKLFLRQAQLESRREIAPGFHLITLAGPGLQAVAWTPGQLLQIGMGDFVARSYTPIEWDGAAGRTRILAYAHASAGSSCEFFGPRGSLNLAAVHGPVLVFGDETSFGLALATRHHHSGTSVVVRCVFEVDALAPARQALAAVGLAGAELVERSANDAHLDALVARLPGWAAEGTSFVLTGKAGSIQRLRQALKPLAVPASRILAKAYWAPGKTGLD